ncbi:MULTISPECIES: hypothetical protein [unclassified Mameliella]|nr:MULTISPECIES: hypothetical protein [unclassified Mameliella]
MTIALSVFLTALGLPEAPNTEDVSAHSSESHPHDDEDATSHDASASGHCHPGLDCSVSAIFLLAFVQSYEPFFSELRLQTAEIRRPNAYTNTDPPPPRRTA